MASIPRSRCWLGWLGCMLCSGSLGEEHRHLVYLMVMCTTMIGTVREARRMDSTIASANQFRSKINGWGVSYDQGAIP
jgi:hypothetical protein